MPSKAATQRHWASWSWAFPLALIMPFMVDANAFQIEVIDTSFERAYPWQLCRGTEGLGIGDQVFAIDREITTCANEGADEYWFATPVNPQDAGLRDGYYDPDQNKQLVNLGGPPTTDPPSPKIYAGRTFKVKRDGKALNFDREAILDSPGKDIDLLPSDRFVNYVAIHHGRKLRIPLGYIKTGSSFRLGYRITQGLPGTLTKDYPAVSFVVSDGSVWESLVPLTDEQRQQYIADLTAQEPKNLREVEFENQRFGSVGNGISQQKGGIFDAVGRLAGKLSSVIRRPTISTPRIQTQFEERKEEEADEAVSPISRVYDNDMSVRRLVGGRIPVDLHYFDLPQNEGQEPERIPDIQPERPQRLNVDDIERMGWPFNNPNRINRNAE
ncbi:hypothetical protein TWF696_007911 [Orbilia brochopaga]|uniref:Uncharacterized protein n=1 Tax=Orbilia brochopaga TaxID=3140254 RepID=A0AAV9UMB7_9PEZI